MYVWSKLRLVGGYRPWAAHKTNTNGATSAGNNNK